MLKRMVERGFQDVDLRIMLDAAESLVPAVEPGRWCAHTRHDKRAWRVIVEPIPDRRALLIITAYPVGIR